MGSKTVNVMESLRDQFIGRYQIKNHLASGGMGDVYKAFDPQTDRLVALKLLQTLELPKKGAQRRFEREVRTIANLEHAAIVPIYDAGEHNGQPYFVMRLMNGGTLSERLADNPPFLTETVRILQRLASALDVAHKKGVIHRDLKPSNILFDDQGDAYLSDFGIAKIVDETTSQTGSHAIGTWPYMCPEIFQGQKVDARADIYALGIILFELLTGQHPFHQAQTPTQWVKAHTSESISIIHEIRRDLPLGCEQVLEKALAKAPEDRFSSAGQMATAMETLTQSNLNEQEREIAVAEIMRPDTVDTATNSLTNSYYRNRLLKWLMGIIFLLGLGTILFLNITNFFNPPAKSSSPIDIRSPQPITATVDIATPAPSLAIEGIIVFIFYDQNSAIYQLEDGNIQRIPENGQLQLTDSIGPILLQSNSGLMEILLPDKTRLYLHENTSLIIDQVQNVNNMERTIITVEKGILVVNNDQSSITVVGPYGSQTELSTGIVEVDQDDQRQVHIDCIKGSCPISIENDRYSNDLTLQSGEAAFVDEENASTEIIGARYDLYNGTINNISITPTPTATSTSTPTVTTAMETPQPKLVTIDIGYSVNNLPIEAVQFGNGPDVIIFVGGLHAGLAPSTVTLAEESIDYFREHPEEIPENITLFIIPSANPDSRIAIGEKEGRYNANGVDLNRNWDCGHVEDPIINGTIEPGRGGATPFSEPEVIALRDFILNNDPQSVVFWMARASNGFSSPGACAEESLVSNDLAERYGTAANYPFVADIENILGFDLNGDAMNWLDGMGIPTIAVLLRDYVEIDFQRNLAGMLAVINESQNIDQWVPTPVLPSAPDEIVFQSNRDGDYEIYIMNIDGSNQRQLTFNNSDDQFPRVSPNGRQIVFESNRDGNPEIYIMNRDGSNQQRLTYDSANDRLPAWSPNGRQIVFHSSRDDSESEIYIMNLNGTGLQLITQTNNVEGHTSWSVTNRLVFNARTPGQDYWQIYTADPDGSNLQKITNTQVDEWSPEWSPDGEQILFLSMRESVGNPGMYLMNANGNELRLLYNGPLLEWGPAWSADGTRVVFSVDQLDNTADIYILNINQPSEAYLLTERGGYPSWAVSIQGTDIGSSTTTTSSFLCLTDALLRWRDNIYPEFADRLGCVQSPELDPFAVYQLYQNGLMVWREDSNTIYVVYYAESYEIHPVTLPADQEFYLNDLTKGAIGYLWSNNPLIQSQLGNPLEAEMGASEFTLQEFANGTIFYFKENNANTYVLMADQNEVRMIQEK